MGDFLPMYSEIFTFFGACLIVGGLFTAYIQNQSYHHIVLGAGLIMSGVHMAIPSLFLFSGVPHESFSILMRILSSVFLFLVSGRF
jgi:hypothetical protein